jgi:hypothetical protein
VFNRPVADQFSSVNFAANTPANPNLAVVTIGSDGRFCYDGAVADHHVILDLAAIIPAANINATDPTRILDTRGEADPPPPTTQPPTTQPPTTQPPTTQPPTTQPPPTQPPTTQPPALCSSSYPDVCIPPGPPDLNCGDIPFKDIRVVAPDEHNLDGNNDGIGCVS